MNIIVNPIVCVDHWINTCSNSIHYPISQYNYDFYIQNQNMTNIEANVFKKFVNCEMGEFPLNMRNSSDAMC